MKECCVCKDSFQSVVRGMCRKCYRKDYHQRNKIRSRELNRIWIEKNPERYKKIRNKARKNLRIEVLNHYSGGDIKCACCGERHHEFLAIDHINNNGATAKRNGEPKGGIGFYTYLRKNNWPTGFQVLCHNCNMAKSFYGQCPHLTSPQF